MIRKVVLLITGLLLAAAVWLLIECWPSPRGYVYEDKTVRQWLGEVFTTNQSQAMAAFRNMGTNAFPGIIHELKKNESPLEKMEQRLHSRLPASLRRRWQWPLAQQNIWSAATLVLLNDRPSHGGALAELVPILANTNYLSREYILSLMAGM